MNHEDKVPPLLAKPTTKPQLPGRILFVIGISGAAIVGIFIVFFIFNQLTRKDTVEDFALLSTGLFEDLPVIGDATIKPSDAELEARIHQATDALNRISWHGNRLAAISRNYAMLIQQAENIQKNAPQLSTIVFGSAEAALGIYTGQRGIVGEGGQKALKGTESLWDAFVAVQKLYGDKHILAVRLADMAPQFSGPMTNAIPLDCSFAEHTPGFLEFQTRESLSLTNSSGQELHNGVIAVRFSDAGGNSYLNLYFVRDWKIDEARAVNYSNLDFPKDTVDGIVRVDVSAWFKEFTMGPITLKKPVDGWPKLE